MIKGFRYTDPGVDRRQLINHGDGTYEVEEKTENGRVKYSETFTDYLDAIIAFSFRTEEVIQPVLATV